MDYAHFNRGNLSNAYSRFIIIVSDRQSVTLRLFEMKRLGSCYSARPEVDNVQVRTRNRIPAKVCSIEN